jgi:DNA-binding LacI/PurR family transcriptional regulator
MKPNRIRLKDIAQKLGISTATVSRALRNRIEISEDLRIKVKQVAKELRYQPNFMATHLRTQRNYSIGVVVPRIIHQYLSSIISGILEEASKTNYQVMICDTGHSYEKEVEIVENLSTGFVDGILICVSNQTKDFTHIEQLKENCIPFVLFDKDISRIKAPKVIVDDYTGALSAVEHLISQGYKHIAHLQDNLINHSSQKRMKGYFSALKKHGIEKDKNLVLQLNEISIEHSRAVTREFLINNPSVDAIFCITDEIAIGAIKAAQDLGKKIPEEFGVVGFSNWQIATVISPTLTSVAQPGVEMGKTATRLLIQQIENKKEYHEDFPTKILKTNLIIRESSTRTFIC